VTHINFDEREKTIFLRQREISQRFFKGVCVCPSANCGDEIVQISANRWKHKEPKKGRGCGMPTFAIDKSEWRTGHLFRLFCKGD
jgi:hypothetical protein